MHALDTEHLSDVSAPESWSIHARPRDGVRPSMTAEEFEAAALA
jgi:hypothetical protein